MPSFTSTRHVPHNPGEMFALVADIERYPEFVPMCEALRIRRTIAAGDGVTIHTAEMSIGYKFIKENFSCRVSLDRPNLTILVEYIDGPFKYLENRWRFKERGDGGTEVEFYINYEFKSRTFAILAGAVFDSVFRKMTDAFERRANEIYRKDS